MTAVTASGTPTESRMRAAYLREQHRELGARVQSLQDEREAVREDAGKGTRFGVGTAAFAGVGSAMAYLSGERWYHKSASFGILPDIVKPLYAKKIPYPNGYSRTHPSIGAGLIFGGLAAWGAAKLTGLVVRDGMRDQIASEQRVIDDRLSDAKRGQTEVARQLKDLGEPITTTTPTSP